MSGNRSSLSSDAALEKALREETTKQFAGTADFTVNTIRDGTEDALDLDAGFFLHDEKWKSRSKTIIKEQIEILQKPAESISHTVSAKPSPPKPKTTKPTTKADPKKRPSLATEQPPKKRQKKSLPKENSGDELSSLHADDSDVEAELKAKKTKRKQKTGDTLSVKASKQSQTTEKPQTKPKRQDSHSELSDAPADDAEENKPSRREDRDSGSELSVLIDEEPKPKKKRQSKEPSDKPRKAAKAKPVVEDDPDQEEIKRLQGWLVRCGIRKIWAFELKPYETPKAKIKHLKEMLSDVGMTGRFSLEKASQIKEARELAADIEAVQEGNEIWGKDGEERSRRSRRSDLAGAEEDEEDEGSAPTKKLVRGPKRYDFLSSGDEESD